MAPTFDPEVLAVFMQLQAAMPQSGPPPVGDIESRRQMMVGLFDGLAPPLAADIKTSDYQVAGSDGHQIRCRLYKKQGAAEGGAGLLYFHGGGYIGGGLDLYDGIVGNIVSNTDVPIFSVDYRLAPDVKYPGNVDDAHKAFLYFVEHAAEFGVDPKKIAIMGDSAGAGLSAALTHYNVEKNGPAIAKQILVYPMLDDRNVDPLPGGLNEVAVWKADDNRTGWEAVLGSLRGTADLKPSAAPARMTVEQAAKLPPAYIECGELDIFRDEDISYAQKLFQAGVPCELHIWQGCVHAFEVMAPQASVSKRAYQARFEAVKTITAVEKS